MWGWDGGVWRVCAWTARRLAGCSSAVVFVTGSLNPSVWNFFLIKGKEFKGEGWVRADWKKGAAENSGRDFSATFHSSKVTKVTGISCATTELFTVTFEIRACVCKIIFLFAKHILHLWPFLWAAAIIPHITVVSGFMEYGKCRALFVPVLFSPFLWHILFPSAAYPSANKFS